MKTLFLILLLASPCLARGPKYSQKDPLLQDEIENIYKDIANLLNGDVRVQNLKGSIDGSDPCTGCVGEIISSAVGDTAFSAGTGNWADLTSIVLTPGRWIVYGQAMAERGNATWTIALVGISSTTGNSSAGLTAGDTEATGVWSSSGTTPEQVWLSIIPIKVTISSDTTYYLKNSFTFSAGTPRGRGRISALRL